MLRSIQTALLAGTLGLTACAGSNSPMSSTPPMQDHAAAGPIWKTTDTPSPMDIVRLHPGESRRVSFARATRAPLVEITGVQALQDAFTGTLEFKPDPKGVTITAPEGSSGRALVVAQITSRSGKERVEFPVVVSPMPVHEFTYLPPAGKSVSRVVAAGSFNGWSQSTDELQKGADGVFRLRRALEAGRHTYKFVVDGEWVPDTGNPKQESGGYGNSVLEIEGTREETFSFAVLGSAMPGSGPQGGVAAVLPPGDSLLPESLGIFVNNRRLEPGEYRSDPETGAIALNVTPDHWLGENFVTVLGKSREGRLGELSFAAPGESPVRSPRDEVIYFPMTDRFADGDPARNNPSKVEGLHQLANYHGGDWAGIRKKIEEGYFTNLGVTTIWISPVVKNTQKTEREFPKPNRLFTSYHGYWPVDSYETNEQFGSMEDLRSLVSTAHEHGIAVLFDFVANHVHEDHPLYREHPDWVTPRKMPDGRDNIRLFDEVRIGTWFDTFLPTLDYTNRPAIVTYQVDNAVFWLRQSGADGLRQDAVKHIPENFWEALTERLDREFGEGEGRLVYQVGETISDRGTINLYVTPEMMHGQFDFPLYFKLREVFALGSGTMGELAAEAGRSQTDYPIGSIMSPLLGNHDMVRFMAYADGDCPAGTNEGELGYTNPPQVDNASSYAKLRLAFAFLMGMPGPPTIFYGDEIGLSGAGDPDNRRPMPWSGLQPVQEETREAVGALARARGTSLALRRGHLETLHASAERMVFARVAAGETVLVALSRKPSDSSMTLVLPGWFGRPAKLEPLVESGLGASLDSNRLRLSDGEYAYGMWRVVW